MVAFSVPLMQPWTSYTPPTQQMAPPAQPQLYVSIWGDIGFFILLFTVIAAIHESIRKSKAKERQQRQADVLKRPVYDQGNASPTSRTGSPSISLSLSSQDSS